MPKGPKTTERPKSAPPLPDFADDAYYRVQLRRSIRYAGRSFSPSSRQLVRGDVLKKILAARPAAIHTAKLSGTP
jgi:hypothetical protein